VIVPIKLPSDIDCYQNLSWI